MKNGVDKSTARERIAVGCNWMCVPGREFPMNDTVKINIAKVLEEALEELKKDKEPSLEKLFSLYKKHLKIAVDVVAEGVDLHLDHIADVTPELIMNLMFHHSIERGEDASRCAELYTIGCDGAGLAVVADSLAAIEQRIEKEKLMTWQDLFTQIENNFENERTRAMLAFCPKYCHGNTLADAWAKKLTENYVKILEEVKMKKGRKLIPGWFSWARTIEYGKEVGALPCGRRKGEPLSHGANPNPGFRQD